MGSTCLVLRSLCLVSSYNIRVFIAAGVKYVYAPTNGSKEHKDCKKRIQMVVVFFPALFILFVCVFSCNSWSMARPNHSYIKQALSMCASRCDTPGPALAGPPRRLCPGEVGHRFQRCPAPSCGLARKMLLFVGFFFFLWNPAASQTCISRFLATHVNAEPFPSIL